MLRAIAIDDEPQALEVIRKLAEKIPFLEMEATFTDALAALSFLSTQPIGLIFLDIKMPDISGLDWLRGLDQAPAVIFTTAYSEYAAESYELEAVDYLVKPIGFNRFLKAVNRAAKLQQTQRPAFTFLKSGHDYYRVDFQDLLYVQSATNYVDFFLTNQRITTRMTLGEALDILPDNFIQVHRSFVVNLKKIDQVIHNHVVIQDQRISVGQRYKDTLMSYLG